MHHVLLPESAIYFIALMYGRWPFFLQAGCLSLMSSSAFHRGLKMEAFELLDSITKSGALPLSALVAL